ncbi:MAG: ATP-binding protein [Candidatus Bathyarchaeota archaeon]|nr:ATP-binding protein [Candidatus Bathyarchaeota archaeon]
MIDETPTINRLVAQQKDCEFSLRYALKKQENNWKNCFILFKLIKKGSRTAVDWDYGNYLFGEQFLETREALEIISNFYKSQKLRIPDVFEFNLCPSHEQLKFLGSKQKYGLHRAEWPMFHCDFMVIPEEKGDSSGHSELLRKNLPYYPDVTYGILNFFGLPVDFFNSYGAVNVQICDYRARIVSLRLSFSKVNLVVETPELKPENMVIKAFAIKDKVNKILPDVYATKGHADFDIGCSPDNLHLAFLSKPDNAKIDGKEIGTWRADGDDSITIERPNEELLFLAQKGEDQHLEYKEHASDQSKKNDLIETVVAYSNSEGGLILIGISDTGAIVGCNHKPEDLTKIIHDCCDPPPQGLKVEQKILSSFNVILIDVPPGSNGPYQSKRDKNFYVRHNATDMKIERSELLDLLERRKDSTSDLPEYC